MIECIRLNSHHYAILNGYMKRAIERLRAHGIDPVLLKVLVWQTIILFQNSVNVATLIFMLVLEFIMKAVPQCAK